jgi:hypothetical protein
MTFLESLWFWIAKDLAEIAMMLFVIAILFGAVGLLYVAGWVRRLWRRLM